jgi:hypothetical protein
MIIIITKDILLCVDEPAAPAVSANAGVINTFSNCSIIYIRLSIGYEMA